MRLMIAAIESLRFLTTFDNLTEVATGCNRPVLGGLCNLATFLRKKLSVGMVAWPLCICFLA